MATAEPPSTHSPIHPSTPSVVSLSYPVSWEVYSSHGLPSDWRPKSHSNCLRGSHTHVASPFRRHQTGVTSDQRRRPPVEVHAGCREQNSPSESSIRPAPESSFGRRSPRTSRQRYAHASHPPPSRSPSPVSRLPPPPPTHSLTQKHARVPGHCWTADERSGSR